LSGSIYLLGKIHNDPAILLVQRTQIAGDAAPAIVQGGLASLNVFLENKPVRSFTTYLREDHRNRPVVVCTDRTVLLCSCQPPPFLIVRPQDHRHLARRARARQKVLDAGAHHV
jgi:hypothetical protein